MYTFKNIFAQKKSLIMSFAVVAVLAVAMIASLSHHNAQAATTDVTLHGDLHGYAWSSTIGWISLNCAEGSVTGGSVCAVSPYKVSVNSDLFSGYAWSSNVGWISFNDSDLAACSGSTPRAGQLNEIPATPVVFGWARVISGTDASGADGCIRLGTSPTGTYGLSYDSGTTVTMGGSPLPGHALTGFAWGDVNVGWVNFNYATISFSTSAIVTLYAKTPSGLAPDTTPLLLPSTGGSFDLVWQSTGMIADSCSATAAPTNPGWTGSGKPTQVPADWTTVMADTTYPITLPANTGTTPAIYHYTLTCNPSDLSGPVSDTVTVEVLPPTIITPTPSITFNAVAVNGVPITPSDSITIDSGSTVTLSWTTTDIINGPSCVGTSLPSVSAWNTGKPSSDTDTPATYSYLTAPLTTLQKYTIKNCMPVGGGVALAPQSVTIEVTDPWCEVTPMATSDTVTGGAPFDITSPFGVIWHGPYLPATISVDTSGTSFTSAFVGSPILPTSTSTVGVEVLGTTTTAQTITVNADSGGMSCRPGTYTIAPTGTTTTLPGHHRPPWQEF